LVSKKGLPGIFFGWWTVLAGGTLCLWGHGFASYGFAALFKPIASELGFSRAVTSVAASIVRLEGGLEGSFTGWITDKFGPKWLILSGVFVMSLSLMSMKFIHSLWAFLYSLGDYARNSA
jgi:sugar phosphate permease